MAGYTISEAVAGDGCKRVLEWREADVTCKVDCWEVGVVDVLGTCDIGMTPGQGGMLLGGGGAKGAGAYDGWYGCVGSTEYARTNEVC